MERTITINGTGVAYTAPDWVELTLTIQSKNTDYDTMLKNAASRYDQLCEAVRALGFPVEQLKTDSYNFYTSQKTNSDNDSSFGETYTEYSCSHKLCLSFPLDQDRLASVLNGISACPAHPSVSVELSLQDPAPVKAQALRNAAEQARSKAKLLAEISGLQLGELVSIQSDEMDFDYSSHTLAEPQGEFCDLLACLHNSLNPSELSLTQNVVFVWELV